MLEVEGRLSGEISASVEHIPELEHHEEREDVALLEIGEAGPRTELEIAQSGERSHIGMLADVDKAEQEEEEEATGDENRALHHLVDDECVAITRLVVHHTLGGRQGSQGHRGEGVHDEVHPKHLRHGEGRIRAHEGTCQHNEASGYVHRHLEEDEALNILVERASPHHRAADARERVVGDRDVTGFFRHRSTVAHRQTDVSRFECGRIVRTVAGHCDNVTTLLQRFDEALLVQGACTSDDFEFVYTIIDFFVAERFEFRSRDDGAFAVMFAPQTDLTTDFCSRCRGVARNDLHIDAG